MGGDLLGYIVHALPPISLLMVSKAFANDIKDNARKIYTERSLADLQHAAERSQAVLQELEVQTEIKCAEIAALEANRTEIQSSIDVHQKSQIERQKSERGLENKPQGADFSDDLIVHARQIYAELKDEKGTRFGAALGRRLGISERGGRKLKAMLDEEVMKGEATSQISVAHFNGKGD